MFHGAHALSDQSLLKMTSSPSVKKKSNNYSSGDVDKSTTEIKAGEITQVKAVHEYGIPFRMLARKCKKKRESMAENRPEMIPVMGESEDKDMMKWSLDMKK